MTDDTTTPWAATDQQAWSALAGGMDEPIARFRFDPRDGTWWWSEGMYALHGFAPGEVTPSTALLLAHKHPDDLVQVETTLRKVLATGEPFCCRHRIIDSTNKVRTVLSLGEGQVDDEGEIFVVTGYFVDLTASLRRDIEVESREAVRKSARSRADIEQAKGMLMAIFSIDQDAAFDLLRWHSQHTNTKIASLAAGLVGRWSEAGPQRSPARWVNDYFGSVRRAPGPGADPGPEPVTVRP